MKKVNPTLYLILLIIFAHTNIVFGQNVQWANKGGRTSFPAASNSRIAVDSSGNSYVCGTFQDTCNFGSFSLVTTIYNDIFLAKYNSSGVVQWARQAGGSNLDYA